MRQTEQERAFRRANGQRIRLAALCALLSCLPIGAAICFVTDAPVLIGVLSLISAVLSFQIWNRVARYPNTQAGHIITAAISLVICLLGLYVAFSRQLYAENETLGFSVGEIIAMLPGAVSSPDQLPDAGWDHAALLLGAAVGFVINSHLRRNAFREVRQ